MVNLPTGLGSGALFTTAWQDKYSSVPERAMNATIKVFTRGARVFDATTDAWVETETVFYGANVPSGSAGSARVQPLRAAQWKSIPGNAAPVQTFLVSIPIRYGACGLAVGQEMRVTNGGLNSDLTKYRFVVTEITDSSNPIERTFYASVDQETVVTP